MDAYSLGQLLRQARDDRELSLDDVKIKTRIAVPILESFESGMFDIADLSQVQVRGMLSNYASFLGLDPELVLNHYALAQSMNSRRRRGRQPAPDSTTSRRPTSDPRRATSESPRPVSEVRRPQTEPRRAQGDPTTPNRGESFGTRRERRSTRRGRGFLNLLVIVTLALASFAVIAAITAELLQRAPDTTVDPGVEVDPQTIADLPPTFTSTPPPTPTTIRTPTLIPRSPQNYQGEPVLVTVDFTQRAWVRMIVDGAELFTGLVRPSELTLEYRALNEIILSSSNAEALAVTYNGIPQPVYGGRGQSIEILYRPNNSVTIDAGALFAPTSEFSPTATETSVQLAATLLAEGTPTATEGPSPTPSDTPSATVTPEFSPTPFDTTTATNPPTITPTLTASSTASDTPPPTETATATPSPLPTAIVPPRVTPVDSTPVKTA
jgi:hypothetical protein